MRPILAPSLLATTLTALVAATGLAQQPDTVADTARYHLPEVRVEVARLAIGGVPLARAPFGAQVITAVELQQHRDLTIADALQRLPGVSAADVLGSPFQPDLLFRGFGVSPVVGLPQGLSVFVDGVRINEPDASQVNFQLIPQADLERVEVLRGPSGAFGKNTLAGAINLRTRRGGPGSAGQVLVESGSFGQLGAQGRVSGARAGFDYYLSGRYLQHAGWRDAAFARTGQLFAKGGWRGARTDVWVSYTAAADSILQAGSLPLSWLEHRDSVPERFRTGNPDTRTINFTGGDYFGPRLHFVNAELTRRLGDALTLRANVYARHNRLAQFNANFTEPNIRFDTRNRSLGGTVQLAHRSGGMETTGGVEYAFNDVGIRIFAHPNAGHPTLPDAGQLSEDVGTREHNLAAFAQTRFSPSPRVALTGALRYDHVSLPFRDRLDPGNNGDNRFRQLTGAGGVDVRAGPGAVLFASYGRGFRAPVIMELACADPEAPCPLPYELGADPPLDPVTTDTWQAGVRLHRGERAAAELIGFWAEVHDDIFFVQPPETRAGFFQNLARTRRQGIEAAASWSPLERLRLSADLALTRATFQTTARLWAPYQEEDEEAPAPPAEPDEEPLEPPTVRPGDRFPMVPALTAGLAAEYALRGWELGLELSHTGSQWLRGDEDNTEEEEKLSPYTLLDVRLERVLGGLVLFAEVRNLLDREHHVFGVLALNRLNEGERIEPFVTPGMPRRLFAGVRFHW